MKHFLLATQTHSVVFAAQIWFRMFRGQFFKINSVHRLILNFILIDADLPPFLGRIYFNDNFIEHFSSELAFIKHFLKMYLLELNNLWVDSVFTSDPLW